MAAVKKKKGLMYKGKPLLRCGNRIYYGNLEDKLMDNTGELGKGQVYRKRERENLYKAIDIGEWWLQDAMKMMG